MNINAVAIQIATVLTTLALLSSIKSKNTHCLTQKSHDCLAHQQRPRRGNDERSWKLI